MTILVVVVGVLAGVAMGVIVARTVPRPEMHHKHRKLLDDAEVFVRQVRTPYDLNRVDVLSAESKAAADRWLSRYYKEFNR